MTITSFPLENVEDIEVTVFCTFDLFLSHKFRVRLFSIMVMQAFTIFVLLRMSKNSHLLEVNL